MPINLIEEDGKTSPTREKFHEGPRRKGMRDAGNSSVLICREDRGIEVGAESLLLARNIPPLRLSCPSLLLPAILSPLSLRDTRHPTAFSASAVPNYGKSEALAT